MRSITCGNHITIMQIHTVCDKTFEGENFRGCAQNTLFTGKLLPSGPCHYVLYTANDSRGKLSQLAEKPQKPRKFSPSKVLPYTVFYTCTHTCVGNFAQLLFCSK